MITVWGPSGMFGGMVRFAVACVGSVTVTLFTVIPKPKFAIVCPGAKCVSCPVIATDTVVPGWATLGTTWVRTGLRETENPLTLAAISAPVVMMTSRGPRAASGAIVTVAVACVASVTVVLCTVIPEPKLALVCPCTKCVESP